MIVKLKRGTTALVAAYVGAAGTLVIDTQAQQLYLQDGVTPGGKLVSGLTQAAINGLIDTKLSLLDVASISGLTAALADKADQSDLSAALDDISALETAVAGKVSSTDLYDAGKIKASLLPSYVDDVLEFAAEGDFPVEGEAGKIYVETNTSKVFRWTGSVYVEIVASPGTTDSVTEGANLYFTDERARQAISLDAASQAGLEYDAATGKFKYTAPAGAIKASGAELIAGVDDSKFATAAGLAALLADIGLTTDGENWTLDEGVLA
jgi:hypothetical protein